MIKLYFKILNSPFVRPKFMVYIGQIKHGHPYFLPRRWIMTSKGFRSPKPIYWFGVDYNGLGWKTKFENYRFEYVPSFSIVLLGIQFYIAYKYNPTNSNEPIAGESYWEGIVNYLYNTEETKSVRERTNELLNNYSCSWRSFKEGEYVTIDYYPLILKKKYRKIYEDKLINDKLKIISIYLRDMAKTTYAHIIIESENERIIDVRSSVDLYEYSKLLLSYGEIHRDNMIEDFTFVSEIRAWYYEVEVNHTTNVNEFKFNLIEKLTEIGGYYDMHLVIDD